jgi:PAS domain S-box-containing protein
VDSDHYRDLVEQSPAMLWRTGVDGVRRDFSAAWLAFTGLLLEQVRMSGWMQAVHPADVDACVASLRDHVERRTDFAIIYRLRHKDGEFRPVVDRGAPYLDAHGAFAGFNGACVEIDERLVPTAIAPITDFFEMSLDNLCVVGFDGYFARVNPSWSRTLGWTADELMSRPTIEFVHPDDREATLAARRRLHDGDAMGPLANRYLCKGGGHRWFEWRSVAGIDRRVVYAAARDVTEQKLAEERLREASALQEQLKRQLVFADRMASVGTLASGAAHEINNPLTSTSTNLALLREELGRIAALRSVEEIRARIAELESLARAAAEGAERIGRIVGGLDAFSRADEERTVDLEVGTALRLAIQMTAHVVQPRARLVESHGAMPRVRADLARLGQVFINLLTNAAQACPERADVSGEIRITTSTDTAGRATIEIADDGRGIPAATLDRIFDPFFTTQAVGQGTGLGLFICHQVVTGMGGELTVQSIEGRGTTFRVALPPADPAPQPAAPPARVATATRRGNVLVVDDDAWIGPAIRRVLQAHDVTAVTSAKDGMALIQSGNHFDVILSDLMMPEMSGMEFHEALCREVPELARRVVFITGGAFTPAAREFLDRVPNPRMDKPFDTQGLRALVARLVG